ncbi:hypothetical protein PV327_010423 [Microctonus hyperodae]|uniref:Protein kinase domain-containing protein n=1 Tax=Microctonus hyperodae TaxID=165561 RepID=A0AA39KUS5_MICHY|nr:hypothetical protein PV327_010423 [Microctonus hyperodae]
MADFKTPTSKRIQSRLENNSSEYQTPLKIPATPYLKQIGYGCGVNVFTLERSPRVGFARSPWAIKKRNAKIIKDKKFDKRIQLEADILRQLKHENIVGFRALTLSETGVPCLAMEQLEISLGDLIEKRLEEDGGPFPAKNIEHVGFEVAKGLEYLHHTVLILHGDLKSYNVLVSNNLKIVKLCDFGVSVPLNEQLELDNSKNDFSYTGTECWNAPEIISDEGPVTNKTDMWAYGLTLWEMIALLPPHVDDESLNESNMDVSMDENSILSSENTDSNGTMMDDSLLMLDEKSSCKYGTRPPLPAIEFGSEYDRVLEVFYLCTDQDYRTRPSAKGVVMYFKSFIKETSESKVTTSDKSKSTLDDKA